MTEFGTICIAALALTIASGPLSAQETKAEESEKIPFAIGKITLVMTNVDAMVDFYGHLFGVDFATFEMGGATLYSGRVAGLNLLLCPNELAGVEAEQSRVQFDLIVPDLNVIRERALAHGGSIKPGEGDVKAGFITVSDPDNNTIVFVEDRT